MSLLIKDILYLPMTGDGKLHNGSIRMEGQHICEIGELSPQKGEEIIYGRGQVALPGFVNCHCHAGMSMLRGYGEGLPLRQWLSRVQSAEKHLDSEDLFWGILLSHLEMLKAGVTCYADMYFDEDAARWAMEESGIRAVLGEGLADRDGRGEASLYHALMQISEHRGDLDGRLTYALAPHAVYSCSGEYLRLVAAEAQQRNLPLHIHVAETIEEQRTCITATGKRVLPYLADLGFLDGKVFAAHMIHLDAFELDIATQYDVRVAHCPQSNMKLASGVLPYSAMKQRGICIGLGTDGPASNNDLDLLEEMRTAALLQKISAMEASVLPPLEALEMATVNGAKTLFLENSIGTLEPGKKADIVLLSLSRPHFYPRNEENGLLSHLVYTAKSGDVHTVIVDGKVRVRDGKCVDLDEERICYEVQKRTLRFWERMK